MNNNTDATCPNENVEILSQIPDLLLSWFYSSHRELPWRADPTPYHVWVSEIMLQQTRVEAVREYYARFMQKLPTVRHLSECPDDQLMKLWEGLGYYSRARNLKKAAQEITDSFGGEIPADYVMLRSLPGIGPYTAGAISSIAFQIPVPAVDGNVLRVISRVIGSRADIAVPATKKNIEQLVQKILPDNRPGDFNQALMELGAMVCVPGGPPHCENCPLRDLCISYIKNLTDDIPVKSLLKKRRIEKKTVLILQDGIYVYLRKRPAKGLLAGLYEPMVLEGHPDEKEITHQLLSHGIDALHFKELPPSKHIFSHIEWHMRGFLVRVHDLEAFLPREGCDQIPEEGIAVLPSDIRKKHSVPSAFSAYREYLIKD